VLAGERAQSLAVIGPTQSGKTTCLAVPAILGWEGPVVAASVKADLLRETLGWRRRCGRVWCFDPTGVTGLAADHWSPLQEAATWPGARKMAAHLTASAVTDATTADGEFWYSTAAKLLGPLLFAASTGGRTMDDVVRWVDTQEVDEVLTLLEAAAVPEALDAARATWLRDDRQRSGVYTTAETVLQGFADSSPGTGVTRGQPIDPGALLSGSNTLFVCAPAHDQRQLRPLFSAAVTHVMDVAFTRAAMDGPLDPPLLVVLDEAANIAPLAELDTLAATCAGHGIQLVTVWQDLAQVAARYGARAATVVNNHRAKLFLSGIADPGTLDHASTLVGDEELLVPSVTWDRRGPSSTTAAPHTRRLLPPDALRRLPAGTGALVYGALPPVRLSLRPWWEDPELAGRAGRGAGRGPGGTAGYSAET
jgi:type IV secretion system protein VirD4